MLQISLGSEVVTLLILNTFGNDFLARPSNLLSIFQFLLQSLPSELKRFSWYSCSAVLIRALNLDVYAL